MYCSTSYCLSPIYRTYHCSFSEIIIERRSCVLRSTLLPPTVALPRSLKSSVGSFHVKDRFNVLLLKLGGHNVLIRNAISFVAAISATWIFYSAIPAILAAISATWIFYSAIPAILALKRLAEALEKLFDAKTNELPKKLVEIQSSCMEICGLTTEINNLREEVTTGIRHSKGTIPLAREVLGVLNNMDASAMAKDTVPPALTDASPVLSVAARTLTQIFSRVRASLKLIFMVYRVIRLSRALIPSQPA